MDRRTFLLFLAISSLLFQACNDRCKRLDGPRVRFEKMLTPTHTLEVTTPADIVLYKDSVKQSQLEIFCQAEVFDKLVADVTNTQLDIALDACFKDQQPILINATMQRIDRIYSSASGEIKTGTIIEQDTLSIENVGLGDIDIHLKTKSVTSHLTSSGNVILSGSANQAICLSSGSGETFAYQLFADSVIVHTLGSGIIEVYANDYLEVNFWAPTTVLYRGNPSQIIVNGEGNLKNGNL